MTTGSATLAAMAASEETVKFLTISGDTVVWPMQIGLMSQTIANMMDGVGMKAISEPLPLNSSPGGVSTRALMAIYEWCKYHNEHHTDLSNTHHPITDWEDWDLEYARKLFCGDDDNCSFDRLQLVHEVITANRFLEIGGRGTQNGRFYQLIMFTYANLLYTKSPAQFFFIHLRDRNNILRLTLNIDMYKSLWAKYPWLTEKLRFEDDVVDLAAEEKERIEDHEELVIKINAEIQHLNETNYRPSLSLPPSEYLKLLREKRAKAKRIAEQLDQYEREYGSKKPVTEEAGGVVAMQD